MGLLDEPGLNRLIEAGCPGCGAAKLAFRTYVDGTTPFMGAEPVGRVTWIYDGEKFVDGVYQVTCAACARTLFTADVCPRCHAPGGLKTALESPNRYPVPARCPSCDEDEVNFVAFLPALVTYEGQRADKARTTTEPHESGFHGYRVDCRDCGNGVAERTDACPLCEAPGPLRVRPG
jgi:ribosomal protein S27E